MKKLLMLAILVCFIVGCGGSDNNSNSSNDSPITTITEAVLPSNTKSLILAKSGTETASVQSLSSNAETLILGNVLYYYTDYSEPNEVKFISDKGRVRLYIESMEDIGDNYLRFIASTGELDNGQSVGLTYSRYIMNTKTGKVYTGDNIAGGYAETLSTLNGLIYLIYNGILGVMNINNLSYTALNNPQIQRLNYGILFPDGKFMTNGSFEPPSTATYWIYEPNKVPYTVTMFGKLFLGDSSYSGVGTFLFRCGNNNVCAAGVVRGITSDIISTSKLYFDNNELKFESIDQNNVERQLYPQEGFTTYTDKRIQDGSSFVSYGYTGFSKINSDGSIVYKTWNYPYDLIPYNPNPYNVFGTVSKSGIAWMSSDRTSIFYLPFQENASAKTVVTGRNIYGNIFFIGEDIIFYEYTNPTTIGTYKYEIASNSVKLMSSNMLISGTVIEVQ